jgi:hypothetical protein
LAVSFSGLLGGGLMPTPPFGEVLPRAHWTLRAERERSKVSLVQVVDLLNSVEPFLESRSEQHAVVFTRKLRWVFPFGIERLRRISEADELLACCGEYI